MAILDLKGQIQEQKEKEARAAVWRAQMMRTKRNKLKLWLARNQPVCPRCLKPFKLDRSSLSAMRVQLHHYPYREVVAKTFAQKLALLSKMNTVIVHPECHEADDSVLNTNSFVIILATRGGPDEFAAYVSKVGRIWEGGSPPLPATAMEVLTWWDLESNDHTCPSCGSNHIHEDEGQLFCWRCLWTSGNE